MLNNAGGAVHGSSFLLSAGGDLVNTATVTSDTFDPNPDNNTVELVRLRPAPLSADD